MVSLSPPAGMGGGGGSVLGGATGASVGAGGEGAGIGNSAVAFGPGSCTSSSPAGGPVVLSSVVVVTGMTVGASVVGGPAGACVCATVKLREGATGGSVGLAVILGGLVMGT